MQKCFDRRGEEMPKWDILIILYIFFKVRKEKRKKKVIYTNVLIHWQNLVLINLILFCNFGSPTTFDHLGCGRELAHLR